ncbi:AGAP007164-PA [Anopheles gambiae str. PEST]|uniref:AGAP007164-PA n=1 Tax=Anopheles gambiae TaxID=7165 RepID=A7URN6_ANOGA|nr:AGAP007164-PA [Anopheles gambiae str. PEST]
MTTLRLIAIATSVCVLLHVAHCEPNYQPQQQPSGNDFSGAGGGVNTGNALYGAPNQQQQQQPRPYPPAGPPPLLARFRPANQATTPAPTFFQRISNWFSFLGDDGGDRRQQQQQSPQQQQLQPQLPQLPPQRHLPPQYTVQPTPSVQTQQQLQFQQQQQQQQQQQFHQQYQPQQPQQQPIQQQPFPYPFQIRNGSRATQLAPQQQQQHVVAAGFQPSAPVQESSGSSYHAAIAPGVHQHTFGPSTLQQQIVPQANVFRDPEPTTGRPPVANIGEVNYHPCNNVPWVPIAPPPEYPTAVGGVGGAIPAAAPPPPKVPPKEFPSVPNRPPPIKIQVAPKGQVQSVNPYSGASGGALEPAIITAAPQAQQLIQLQLQQQQHQLQNLQLQQLQLQQQQLQQQLQQLKTTTSSTTVPPVVPVAAHFITKTPDAIVTAAPSSTLQPITLRQVSASYFTNKEYAPPAKLLPIQNEGKPLAPIPLPNLSATPIPPLYTAGSFHSDPYKFYRPYRPVEPIRELGHGYPTSSKSMSNSYIRYPHNPAGKNDSIFDVEQFASSASSSIYTTVAYSNGEDSKPAASEKRNVATSSNGSSGANNPPHGGSNGDDAEYDSEEDDQNSPIIRTTIEVSSIVPQTRYYGSTTTPVSPISSTTTQRPERYSTFPAPAPSDLGNGVQIIYSANLQTNPPINPVNNQLIEEQEEPTEPAAQRVVQTTTVRAPTTTVDPETTPPTDIYTEPFRIGSSLPMEFQKQPSPEPDSQTVVTASPSDDPLSTTGTPLPSSLTATFGGYQNLMSTKKPKQIQIIIPYNTFKKPEPFKPLPPQENLEDLDYNAPAESSIVTSKHAERSGPTPPSGNAIQQSSKSKTRFIENDSVKYFQSTTHLKEILQKETTQPFMKPPTKTPPKPAKVKKVRPIEISKESKPFTVRIPKMTPLPPVVSLSSLTSVRGGMERHTTPLPDEGSNAAGGGSRTPSPPIALSKYARPVTPHYVNVTRVKISPTTYAQKSRTTISQLLRTTKIIPKGPKLFGNDLLVSETVRTVRPPLSPASTTYQQHRRTTLLTTSSTTPHTTTTTTTTEQPPTPPQPPAPVHEDPAGDNTVGPIYERTIDWDIDPNELQRKIDTWTEQEFGSEDFARKASTLSLHRVTKAIPWEFLTSTMLPALHDKPGKSSRSGWQHVKIAISPITKEKIYVVTPQPWTVAAVPQPHHSHHHRNHHHEHHPASSQVLEERNGRVLTPRFSVRPTPLYYKGGGIYQTGSSTVDVSPESVNDLLEQKPKHRFSISSSSSSSSSSMVSAGTGTKVKHLLQQRKYVRKKLPFGGPGTGRPSSSREDV